MRPFLMAAACVALDMIAPVPSRAEVTYPWCAQYVVHSNCGFATLEQCRAALDGNGGYCDRNPMFRPPEGAVASRRRE